jgi:hypothetical protein
MLSIGILGFIVWSHRIGSFVQWGIIIWYSIMLGNVIILDFFKYYQKSTDVYQQDKPLEETPKDSAGS